MVRRGCAKPRSKCAASAKVRSERAAGRHADAAALVGGVLAVVLEALDKLAQARRA